MRTANIFPPTSVMNVARAAAWTAVTCLIFAINGQTVFASDWTGKTVFPKDRRQELKVDGRVVSEFFYSAKVVEDLGDAVRVVHADASSRFPNVFTGFAAKEDLVRLGAAPMYFTSYLQKHPDNVWGLMCRGKAWQMTGEYELAVEDLDEAVRVKPSPYTYLMRGIIHRDAEHFDEAIADFSKTVELNPNYALGYCRRAYVWSKKRDFKNALEDYEKAVAIDSRMSRAYGAMAWIYATAEDDAHRDGDRAVAYARKACELTQWQSSSYMGTFSAALAEVGAFEEAIEMLEQAIELQPDLYKELRQTMLAGYREGRPYRDENDKDDASDRPKEGDVEQDADNS